MSGSTAVTWTLRGMLGAVCMVCCSTASAQQQQLAEHAPSPPSPDPALKGSAPWQRQFAIEAHSGLGTPFGYGGAALELTPIPFISIAAGAGVTYVTYARKLVPVGVSMLRVRYPFTNAAVGLGLGSSWGEYDWQEGGGLGIVDHPASKSFDLAVWFNAEVAYEYRFDFGLQLRTYLGLSKLLNVASGVCRAEPKHCENDHQGDPNVLPYLGFAIGYAFPI